MFVRCIVVKGYGLMLLTPFDMLIQLNKGNICLRIMFIELNPQYHLSLKTGLQVY